ncbi:YlbF family regulator [Halocatena pleomorpha]|uniref:YlbF family regulator n=1 Tax=Halocatena pleomorpha TaxID=1785090 RepID=A0A3P3R5V7_9EURY|nr:YlbF family regulator [Halocatena pleomorpha]RRJ28269.1 YlbF family regulator [Halocatena pleomorpha]
MSTETTADAEIPQATVTELASDLGEAITQLPTYQEFLEAKERVEASEEAQQKVQRFEQLREEFMLARQTGNATNEDLRELQAAQEELHDVPVMSDFLELQSELELELQELNEMISAPLSVDFGEKAGGCCQD